MDFFGGVSSNQTRISTKSSGRKTQNRTGTLQQNLSVLFRQERSILMIVLFVVSDQK